MQRGHAIEDIFGIREQPGGARRRGNGEGIGRRGDATNGILVEAVNIVVVHHIPGGGAGKGNAHVGGSAFADGRGATDGSTRVGMNGEHHGTFIGKALAAFEFHGQLYRMPGNKVCPHIQGSRSIRGVGDGIVAEGAVAPVVDPFDVILIKGGGCIELVRPLPTDIPVGTRIGNGSGIDA